MTRAAQERRQTQFLRLLVEARREAGLTQTELAKRLRQPQSFVSKFENGERRLDVLEFLDVTRALGADPQRILSDLEGKG